MKYLYTSQQRVKIHEVKLINLSGQRDKSSVISGDFNICLPVIE